MAVTAATTAPSLILEQNRGWDSKSCKACYAEWCIEQTFEEMISAGLGARDKTGKKNFQKAQIWHLES